MACGYTCYTCNGSGKVTELRTCYETRQSKEVKVTCPTCNGSGEVRR